MVWTSLLQICEIFLTGVHHLATIRHRLAGQKNVFGGANKRYCGLIFILMVSFIGDSYQTDTVNREDPATRGKKKCLRHNGKKPSRREYGFSVFIAMFL